MHLSGDDCIHIRPQPCWSVRYDWRLSKVTNKRTLHNLCWYKRCHTLAVLVRQLTTLILGNHIYNRAQMDVRFYSFVCVMCDRNHTLSDKRGDLSINYT